MSVMIGIDPHKALHAVCAIDRHETELAEVVVRSGPRQLDQLLKFASPFETRTWAIESASGLGYLLAQQLLARGELVVDVPATLSSRARLLGSGRSNKNDTNDARAVAGRRLAGAVVGGGAGRGSCLGAALVGQSAVRHRACA